MARQWFDRTHQVASDFGRAYWLRTALPRSGGVGDQDAWLMQALDAMREVQDELLHESVQRSKNDSALKNWRAGRQKNGRT